MKIGVALSGCDIGGVGACEALWELEKQGFEIGMISACGTPSVSALAYAYSEDQAHCRRQIGAFLETIQQTEIDTALADYAQTALPSQKAKRRAPLVISGVNVADGRIAAFTEDYSVESGRLQTFPLHDAYDALSASLSPAMGLASYPYQGLALCDFSVWYGQPVYPLRMSGFDKIIALSFLPAQPKTPYEVLVSARITASASLADAYIPVQPKGEEDSPEAYFEAAAACVRREIESICLRVLF